MNRFVKNPYFFANVSNRSFGSTSFDRFYVGNYIASIVCGAISIATLYFMIIYKSPKTLRDFRKILLITVSVDFFLLIVYAFGQVRIRFYDQLGLYSMIGFASLLPFDGQVIAYAFHSASTILTCLILPLPFYYRDHMLRYGKVPKSSIFAYLGLIIAALCLDTAFYLIGVYSTDDSVDYSSLWFEQVPIPPLIAIDPNRNWITYWSLTYREIELFSGFIITFVIVIRSYRLLKNKQQDLSSRSKFMSQYTRLLFVQLFIPMTILFIPLAMLLFFIYFSINDEVSQHLLMIFYTWVPFINSSTTLILIVPYRQVIVGKLRSLAYIRSKTTSVTQVRSVSISVNNKIVTK